MALFHLVSWPREPVDPPYACLVLLHGRGSNEQDLFGMVPELPRRAVVLSVRAPNPFPWGGYFWYELKTEHGGPDELTLNSSLKELHSLLETLPDTYQVDPAQIYLLGFSQGALTSGCLLVSHPEMIAGAAMLSGYLPEGLTPEGIAGKAVFMAHGSADSVLPVVLGRQARLKLEGAGADVEYHEYPMDHQVSEAELSDLRHWFAARTPALT
ncbi:MAG: phospholipase [Chloroflexi bacterium]|nr:phospholipase [Chloroflexota bacterium]